MGIKKELGKKIKKMRIERGYTQDKLAELVDISQKALSSIELGENFVSAETLDKILSAFEIHTLDNLNIVLILSPTLIHNCFIPIIIFFSISFVLMHISKKIWISNQCNRKKSIPWSVLI